MIAGCPENIERGIRQGTLRPTAHEGRSRLLTTDVWLLMSGGLDSTACAHYYKSRGDNVTAVFVDFGQPAARRELQAVKDVATYMRVPLTILSFDPGRQFGSGEIMGRNAFLIFSLLLGVQPAHGIVSLGIHSGTMYYDCGPEFVQTIGRVVDAYSSGRLTLHCPFVNHAKSFVYALAKAEGVPLHLTYSCELGTTPPCGICLSCKDRHALKTS